MSKCFRNKMTKKALLVTVIAVVLTGGVGCKNIQAKKAGSKDALEEKVVETQEPCVFINEWDKTMFQVFGFEVLNVPQESFYHTIEKGRTYVIGEFSTDELDVFLQFFKDIHRVMWGEVNDPLQVIEKQDDIYSFEAEYAVPQIYKEAIYNGTDTSDRPERYAYLKVQYVESEQKCTLECRLIDRAEQNRNKKN